MEENGRGGNGGGSHRDLELPVPILPIPRRIQLPLALRVTDLASARPIYSYSRCGHGFSHPIPIVGAASPIPVARLHKQVLQEFSYFFSETGILNQYPNPTSEVCRTPE